MLTSTEIQNNYLKVDKLILAVNNLNFVTQRKQLTVRNNTAFDRLLDQNNIFECKVNCKKEK